MEPASTDMLVGDPQSSSDRQTTNLLRLKGRFPFYESLGSVLFLNPTLLDPRATWYMEPTSTPPPPPTTTPPPNPHPHPPSDRDIFCL